MIEIISILVQKLVDSISLSAIVKNREDKELRKIGTEIFLLYTSLNEIFILGNYILQEFKSAENWLERNAKAGEYDRRFHTHINLYLYQQAVNLVKFIKSLKKLALELQVIDANLYRSLSPLMTGKLNVIAELIRLLSPDEGTPTLRVYPEEAMDKISKIVDIAISYGPDYDGEMEKAAELVDTKTSFENERDILMLHFGPYGQSIRKVLLTSEPLDFQIGASLGQDSLEIIRFYLLERNPENRLQQIEQSLHNLHSAIERSFSTKDILLEVGDRRATPYDTFIGFY
jgi:hypothetical protein